MASQKDEESKPKGRGYIRYIGASGRRGLTVADFRSVGVNDQKEDVWWTRENQWTVKREDLTDDAYNMAVLRDPELILVGGDEKEGSITEEQAEDRTGLASHMTPMPPGPESPDDFVGGGSLTGGGTGGATTTRGATGGSASGSTASK